MKPCWSKDNNNKRYNYLLQKFERYARPMKLRDVWKKGVYGKYVLERFDYRKENINRFEFINGANDEICKTIMESRHINLRIFMMDVRRLWKGDPLDSNIVGYSSCGPDREDVWSYEIEEWLANKLFNMMIWKMKYIKTVDLNYYDPAGDFE